MKLLLGLICCVLLHSQIINPSDLIEQLNSARKQNLILQDLSPLLTPPKENLKEEKELEKLEKKIQSNTKEEDLPCFKIHTITLQSSLPNALDEFTFLEKILKKYQDQCLNQKQIYILLEELKKEAIEKGYSTTLFALPPQNLKSGELMINIETSIVGSIHYPSLIAFWGKDFAIREGDILDISPLERGIYNYRRLRTLFPRFFIQPQKSDSAVAQTQIDVEFNTKQINGVSLPFYLSASVDNGGNSGSGIYQTSFQVGLENLLSLGEILSSYSVITPCWKSNQHSFYTSLDFSIPFRRFLLGASGSYSFYAYPLKFVGKELKYNGHSGSLEIRGKVLVYMDNLNQFSISFGLGKRWAKNFLEQIELLTQRRDLTYVFASLDYLRYFQNSASVSLSIGVKQGIKALGSMDNFPSNQKNPPNFFYTLPVLDSYFNTPFVFGEHRLHLSSLVKTQFSRTQLYASEKMGLGGMYSVRGFESNALSGDFGILNRNDLTYYPPSLDGFIIAPSIGIDMGYVADIFSPSSFALGNRGFLSGGGIGLKMNYKEYFQAQIWGYKAFYNPKKEKERYFFFSIGCGL